MTFEKSAVHSIRYNAMMNVILTTSGMLFPLISVPYVSRILSAYGLGAVAFAQSLMSYFLLVSQFGIGIYGVRTCAAVRDNRSELSHIVKELLALLAVTASITFIVYVCSIIFLPRLRQESMLHYMFGIVIWLGSFGVEWFYQALEQYDYITLRSLVLKAVGLMLMFVFVRNSDDYIIYGWIIILTGYGSNIVNILRLRRFCDFKTREKLHPFRHLRKMVWFAVASSSSNMYIQTDIILLGFLGTNAMVGVYQIVSKIENILKSAVNSVGNVMLPRMSYYTSHGREDELKVLMAKTVNFVSVVSAFVITGCTLCASEIVGILGGEKFAEAALPLIMNGPAVFFAAMNIPLASYLVAYEGERKWAQANLICLLLSYAVGVPLVSIYGMIGAGISVSITECAGMLLRGWFCRKLLSDIMKRIDALKAFVASAVAGVASLFFWRCLLHSEGLIPSLLSKGIMFSVVYALLLWMFRETFFREIISRVLGNIRKQKGECQ